MKGWTLVLLAAALCAASLWLLWSPQIPLGVPGEWTWGRLEISDSSDLAASAALLLAVAAAYLWFARFVDIRIETMSWLTRGASLTALAAAGFAWLWMGQSAAIEGVGLGKAPYVLFYERTSGYFWHARYESESAAQVLRDYDKLMAERDYLHIGTHPPGLILLFHGLLRLTRESPEATNFTDATQPDQIRRAMRLIQQQAALDGTRFDPTDATTLWLATLLAQTLAALTAIPIYLWIRSGEWFTRDPAAGELGWRGATRRVAWRAATFWPLVPAVAVFLPKADAVFPALVMTAAWLWRSGWGRCSLWRCALAGGVLWTGMFCSLAFLPAIALIGLQMLLDGRPRLRNSEGEAAPASTLRLASLITAGAAGFVLPILALLVWADHCLVSTWWWNFQNHALFYDHNPRTRWLWLLVNPLELTLAVGAPVALLAKTGALRSLVHRDWRTLASSGALSFAAVWGLLWISGKNMGEAARLWIFLMPWLAAATATSLMPPPSSDDSTPWFAMTTNRWLALLALQAIVAAGAVLKLDGFHFMELTAGP